MGWFYKLLETVWVLFLGLLILIGLYWFFSPGDFEEDGISSIPASYVVGIAG